MMKRFFNISIAVLLLIILSVGCASAADWKDNYFESATFGAKLQNGFFSFLDHNENERYGATFPIYVVFGECEIIPGAKVSAEYSFGTIDIPESDEYYIYKYDYKNLKIEGAVKVLNNVYVIAGWTKFHSTYLDKWDNEMANVGSGFKVGLSTNFTASERISASVKYAFLPRVYSQTLYVDDGDEYDNYMGPGHELEGKVSINFKGGIIAEVGFKNEIYTGISSCCEDCHNELAAVSSLFAGIAYRF